MKNEILLNLDFTNLLMFVCCIKGKQTKHTKKEATSSTQLLEMIHTDVCGPFDVPLFNGEKYFTIFIDDFLCYGYIYLLYEKSQVMNVLKVYINKVEMQLDRKIKTIRLDRGKEYYRRYNEVGQCPGFWKILLKVSICAQYTMPDTLQQNDVVKKRNCTLIDMVRSMMSNTSLPKSVNICTSNRHVLVK